MSLEKNNSIFIYKINLARFMYFWICTKKSWKKAPKLLSLVVSELGEESFQTKVGLNLYNDTIGEV